jgi:hypothetical protein
MVKTLTRSGSVGPFSIRGPSLSPSPILPPSVPAWVPRYGLLFLIKISSLFLSLSLSLSLSFCSYALLCIGATGVSSGIAFEATLGSSLLLCSALHRGHGGSQESSCEICGDLLCCLAPVSVCVSAEPGQRKRAGTRKRERERESEIESDRERVRESERN